MLAFSHFSSSSALQLTLFYYVFCFTPLGILILLSLNSITGSPNRHRRDEAQDENIVGEATNIIASTILKGNVDLNKNFVFSPFGISAILNILNEGAADETSSSISSVLRQPEQRERGIFLLKLVLFDHILLLSD